MTRRGEPRFDIDLRYGLEAERLIKQRLNWVAIKGTQVEVKRKSIIDGFLFVETECDKGRTGVFQPSGINVTTSAIWIYVIASTGIHVAIPTSLLRNALDDATSTDVQCVLGNCPTRGKLVDFSVLLFRLRQLTHGVKAAAPVVASDAPTQQQSDQVFQPFTAADVLRW